MPQHAVARTGDAKATPKAVLGTTSTVVRAAKGQAPTGPPVLRLITSARAATLAAREEGIADLVAAPSSGEPLPAPVRRQLEASLRVDLAPVRVHTDARTRGVVDRLGARAFTFGRRIFLGSRERPTDVALMAHEAAHVVQQRGIPQVQMSGGGRTPDALEHEAEAASAAVTRGHQVTVAGRTSPRPQFGIGDWVKKGISAVADVVGDIAGAALKFIKDKANNIPGYAMLGFILGKDPITGEAVPRNAVNLIRAVMGLWPGGNLIFEALQSHGIIDKVGAWLDPQIATLKAVVGGIRQALDKFISTLGPGDLLNLGGAWERAKRIFSEPIDRAGQFIKGLALGVLGFIRDAILMPIARLAEGTRGYDLLKAVLGKDPITGKPVPQDAMTLIGGFLKLVGEDEIFENMKKANALPRAFAWFNKALAELKAFVREIPPTFITALKSLDVADMILIPRAFIKLGKVFGGFLVRFISWAGGTIWNLLEIIFEVVKPGALEYIKKTGAALKTILKNPLPFVGNLVKAAKLGFGNFMDHFGGHLKAALIDWLVGSLPGIYIPKSFDLLEIVKFVFSVLGLSWANIRAKLVTAVGETVVKAMETGVVIVVKLVKEGPTAAWEEIKSQLTNLKDMVVNAIIGFVVDTIVKKAIPKLIAMFIPGAGFISAIISIYDTVMVFVEKIATIIQVVKGFIDSIVNIANGVIDAAAKKVESTLAKLMSLAIAFLAGFLGLGKIADKVMGVIKKVQDVIDNALNKLIAYIVTLAKKVAGKVKSAVGGWWKKTQTFEAEGEKRTFYFEGEDDKAVASVKASPGEPISEYLKKVSSPPSDKNTLDKAKKLAADLDKRRPSGEDVEKWSAKKIKLYDDLAPLLTKLTGKKDDPISVVTFLGLQAGVGSMGMEAKILSPKHEAGTGPSDRWPLWDALDPLIGGPPNYVRGHMLNENIGGKGKMFNLTPITSKANSGHKLKIENDVKAWVAAGEVVYYKVEAEYGSTRKKDARQRALEAMTSPTPTDTKELAALDAERKLAKKLVFKAYVLYQKKKGDSWTKNPNAKGTLAPISGDVPNV